MTLTGDREGSMNTTGLAQETIPADEAATIEAFIAFLKETSAARAEGTPAGIRRFNQARASGCMDAEFIVPAGLPEGLRTGLFAQPGSYTTRVRFANATSEDDSERDIRGVSIKVQGVVGENLTPGVSEQDFVLNSHPVMMASDAKSFMELLRANEAGGVRRAGYFATHPRAAKVAIEAQQHHSCHLDIPYWSATPYLFGEGRAVKYGLYPTSSRRSPEPPHRPSKTYLTDALIRRVAEAESTFDLMVQFQVDARRTPIEDAMEEWSDRVSPYQRVATLRIPPQRIDAAEQWQECERMRFNPWHALTAHRPLGSMNRARRVIYQALADFRQGVGR